jgi:hypothetical protein
MCGCTKKTINTTRELNSTTRNLMKDRSLNMSKVATPEILESLHEQYPNEFVLAEYNNGNNFRYAKSVNAGLIPFNFDYYGVFSGKRIIYVHKSDINNVNIVPVKIPQIEQPKIVETVVADEVILNTVDIDESVDENAEDETILENKPKRKRKKVVED